MLDSLDLNISLDPKTVSEREFKITRHFFVTLTVVEASDITLSYISLNLTELFSDYSTATHCKLFSPVVPYSYVLKCKKKKSTKQTTVIRSSR